MTGPLAPLVWAQYRCFVNRLPQWRVAAWLAAALGALFYGAVTALAVVAGRFCAQPPDAEALESGLARGLLLVTLYWQVVPLALSASGVSLDTKRLRGFPVPRQALFGLDLALRSVSSPEALIVLSGAAVGLAANASLPVWAPLGIAALAVWNALASMLVRDVLARLWRRKLAQILLSLALVSLAAVPRLLAFAGPAPWMRRTVGWVSRAPWPWALAAHLASGHRSWYGVAALALWCGAAWWLARRAFLRAMNQDETPAHAASSAARGAMFDAFAPIAARWLGDPLAAILEKEIRSLVRSPRFLLTFVMGFTFSVAIFVPPGVLRGDDPDSFVSRNYLAGVALYSVLLLGQVLLWNCLGSDRAAAAIYFVTPAHIRPALVAKNVAAALFLLLEITLVAVVCALLRLPVSALACLECYGASFVMIAYLLAAGNLVSVSRPWPQDPAALFRSSTGTKMQPLLLMVFPVAAVPVALAYLARYAFASETAFFAVLIIDAAIGAVVYRIAIQSSVETAVRTRETVVQLLSAGGGPMS